MPSMTNRQTVGANATVQNVFQNQLHYRLRGKSKVNVYATASAVGLNISAYVGDELFIDDQEVSAQNRMPLVPDDAVVQMAGFAGDEIVIKWRNTTGAGITGFVRVDVDQVGA